MNKMTTLHIPIDSSVRKGLESKAKSLGFDSAQAYIRVWAKAEAEGRKLDFGDNQWGEPSDAAARRLNKLANEAHLGINVSESYDTVEDFMKDLKV
jgi:hypothetical protein